MDFVTKRFEDHPEANAWVWEYPDGHKTLCSYGTIVAECSAEGWVRVFGLYSATTRKHIGWFMHSLGLDYPTAKEIYEEHLAINIHTGEVVDFYDV